MSNDWYTARVQSDSTLLLFSALPTKMVWLWLPPCHINIRTIRLNDLPRRITCRWTQSRAKEWSTLAGLTVSTSRSSNRRKGRRTWTILIWWHSWPIFVSCFLCGSYIPSWHTTRRKLSRTHPNELAWSWAHLNSLYKVSSLTPSNICSNLYSIHNLLRPLIPLFDRKCYQI